MNFIAIDFETANFKRQSICSIGIAVVENSEIVKTVERLVKPTPDYYEGINMSIHGIKPEMTEDQPTFKELWNEIKPFFENQKIVAHNASFDMSALRYVLDAYNIPYPEIDYYCTMLISKKIYPGLINYQLPTVCKHLEIEDLTHHNAVSDALAAAKIMINILKHNNINSFEELENAYNFSRGKIHFNTYSPFSIYIGVRPETKDIFDRSGNETDPKYIDKEHPFYNKRVVFTGALTNLPREDAKRIVEKIGGITKPENLSSKTNFLVVGTYDYNKYGKGFKSGKLKKAEELIARGKNLEIISEKDFLKMIHFDNASFEITVEEINKDSNNLLSRHIYSEFYGKKVYFSSDLSFSRYIAFQSVGNCGGYGHDYDTDEIVNSDYFIIADKLIKDLEKGIKQKSLIDFENNRREAQNRGDFKDIQLISESAFIKYMKIREKHIEGKEFMNIYDVTI